MPKYYVKSNDIVWVGDAPDHMEACVKALNFCSSQGNQNQELKADINFYVNEVGFLSPPVWVIDTEEIILEANWEFEEDEED
jgi:hypothetical protein|tara:strand:- start:291 stop:536 length:246 start_codon:yes stop_codon:yes gene_type:complete